MVTACCVKLTPKQLQVRSSISLIRSRTPGCVDHLIKLGSQVEIHKGAQHSMVPADSKARSARLPSVAVEHTGRWPSPKRRPAAWVSASRPAAVSSPSRRSGQRHREQPTWPDDGGTISRSEV